MMECYYGMSRQIKKQVLSEGQTTVLRQLRENAGLTREQLISRLDHAVSLTTLARWENEGIEPTLTRRGWKLFCLAVQVRFEDLPETLSELKPAKTA